MQESYGKHLWVDGLVSKRIPVSPILIDPKSLGDFLIEVVESISMRILKGPFIAFEEDKSLLDNGPSGVIILYESHIALHAYPARRAFFLDLFSCKPFSEIKVIDLLKDKLYMSYYTKNIMHRGLHWDTTIDIKKERDKRENLNMPIQL